MKERGMLFKLQGVPCGWNICTKNRVWEVGWKWDGRLESRQELGREECGVGMPCQRVWAVSEDREHLLTAAEKSDQDLSPV